MLHALHGLETMELACLTAPTKCSERMAISCFEIDVDEAFRLEQMKICAPAWLSIGPTWLPAYHAQYSWSSGDPAGCR